MPASDKKIDVFVPDGSAIEDALSRTTHLAIVAHQDDLEINCFAGIAQCYQREDQWFTGIVMSDGAGSPRSGKFAKVTDSEMAEIRKQEQHTAAELGQYSAIVQYSSPSSQLKNAYDSAVTTDLVEYLKKTQAQTVYLHNLGDRHATHVRVAMYAMEALRRLAIDKQPNQILGVEGWGNLDWLPEPYRVRLNVDLHRQLHNDLIRVFESQIAGGKRYDVASQSRHLSNATFDQSHTVDQAEYLSLAMDLSPLLANPQLTYADYVASAIEKFSANLMSHLNAWKVC